MKKLLLSSFFIGALGLLSFAQNCTPGANFVDSTYGVWPDTIQNFPPAETNVAYSTDLNFKVPSTVTIELDPSGQFVGSPIQSFTVTGVQGLPSGYNYACNISNCTYNGGQNGCANVYGTTATSGVYPITIDVDATVLVTIIPGLPPTPVTQSVSFGGYKIVVGTTGIVTQFIAPIMISPNPSNGIITVSGITEKMHASAVSIVDVNGQVLHSENILDETKITMDVSSLSSGFYFLNIEHDNGTEVIRFSKE